MAKATSKSKEKKAQEIKCPSCRGKVPPRVDNPDFPFCSQRCKAVDLARWFTGSYVVPGANVRSDDEEPALPLRDEEKQ